VTIKTHILIDGVNRSDDIRKSEVTQNINPISSNPVVREILVDKQREIGKKGGVVMDGRDIGTVVFPDAELKVFMLASVEERAKRRVSELNSLGKTEDFQKVLKEIQERDKADETREVGPLKKADDAEVVDTTILTFESQTDLVHQLALTRIHKN